MSTIAFVLGNGESRKNIKINKLKEYGKVWACNGVFRTEEPDVLIAVDPKMIKEICETAYPETHEVWSNFNHQYEKLPMAKHINFFKPSLGWSSGPTGLKQAADGGFKKIYILGFDYQGHPRGTNKKSFSFNNMFKDSQNYKKSSDEATFHGNWLNQTKRVLKDYPDTTFYRVINADGFKPNDLEFSTNFKHIDIEDFISEFKLI
jgi:hypothetical protein